MSLTHWITETLQQFAYQPNMVYVLVIVIMLLAGFGLPIPEEAIIITTSLMAYMALNPDVYPPPVPGATGVNVYILMGVCFFAVFFSDLVVFTLGRKLGKNLNEKAWFQKFVKPQTFRKVKFWTQKYGAFAVGLFRFLPGLRFPGHLACGALGITFVKFIAVDIPVILVTIPTQVYLISFYGESVLKFFEKFRFFLLGLVIVFLGYILWTVYLNFKNVQARALKKIKA